MLLPSLCIRLVSSTPELYPGACPFRLERCLRSNRNGVFLAVDIGSGYAATCDRNAESKSS